MSKTTSKAVPKSIPVRRPGGRTAEVSQRIFDTVIEILVRGGLAECTFQSIAAEAGVDRSTLYRRWPDRASLVLDAIAARIDVDVALSDTGTLDGDLSHALRQLARFLGSPVGRAALHAVTESSSSAKDKFQRELWDRRWLAINALFQRAIARGEMAPTADCEAILGAAAGAMYFRILVAGRPINSEWIDRVLSVLVRR